MDALLDRRRDAQGGDEQRRQARGQGLGLAPGRLTFHGGFAGELGSAGARQDCA